MRKLLVICLLVAFLLSAGWLLYHRHQINNPGDFFRLVGSQLSQLTGGARPHQAPWMTRPEHIIRIGSFNANQLNASKIDDPAIARILYRVIGQFDVVAVQEIDHRDVFAMKRLLNQLNATGREYRLASGAGNRGQMAFLYDASTIELEARQVYQVKDPDNLIQRDPLVGWFRTVTPDWRNAFTFSLVNVNFDPQSVKDEMLQITRIFRAVRNDGRQEDDVILAGDFGVGHRQLNQQAISHGLQAIHFGNPTNTEATAQFDNLMIDPLATSEFTGRSGTFDFMKQFNLTLVEAMAVSDHIPVWADFTVNENGDDNRVAHRLRGVPPRSF